MEQPTSTPKPKANLPNLFAQIEIGPSEIMYLAGLVLLFVGVWNWMGLGQACATVGFLLMVTALLIALAEANHAI